MDRRQLVSKKVTQLRNLNKYPELKANIIAQGVDARLLDEYIAGKIRRDDSKQHFTSILTQLTDLGGVVSGGAVISLINKRPVKDVDIYFNDEYAYIQGLLLAATTSKIDICWYFVGTLLVL